MLKVLLIDDEERATDALRLIIEKMVPEIKQVLVAMIPGKQQKLYMLINLVLFSWIFKCRI